MFTTNRRTFIARTVQWATLASVPQWACGDSGSSDDSSTTTATGSSGTSGPAAATETSEAVDSSGAGTTVSVDGTTGGSTAGDSTSASTTSDESSTGSDACVPTAEDIEGPFYRPDIPIGGDLDVWGDDGVPLTIAGRVVGADCRPLRAVVEIWHATPVPPGAAAGRVADATYDGTREYRYYGQVATAADGAFEFRTLRPGWYLNGAAYRPAHVHVKVWVGDAERLTTQLYFVGDPFNEDDQWFNPDLALDPDEAGAVEIELVV